MSKIYYSSYFKTNIKNKSDYSHNNSLLKLANVR